jgi:hypothetical protein
MSTTEREAATERELIDYAIGVAEGHKGLSIREALPGVTEHDISRWRRHPDSTLTGAKKRAIISAMARRGVAAESPVGDSYVRQAMETETMWDRLAVIETIPDTVLQLLRVEALAAVIRAEALRLACEAAGREVGVAETRARQLADR